MAVVSLVPQVETGNPYMLYKDTCNRKSNQQNLGTIKCSNLCTEIVEFTSPEETAVCNLASIALPRFVRERGSNNDRAKLIGSLNAPNRFARPGLAGPISRPTLGPLLPLQEHPSGTWCPGVCLQSAIVQMICTTACIARQGWSLVQRSVPHLPWQVL